MDPAFLPTHEQYDYRSDDPALAFHADLEANHDTLRGTREYLGRDPVGFLISTRYAGHDQLHISWTTRT